MKLPVKYRGLFLSLFSGEYTNSIHTELKTHFQNTAIVMSELQKQTTDVIESFKKQKKINKRGNIKDGCEDEVNTELEKIYNLIIDIEFPLPLIKKILALKQSRLKEIISDKIIISKSVFITQIDNKSLENEINVLKDIIKINK